MPSMSARRRVVAHRAGGARGVTSRSKHRERRRGYSGRQKLDWVGSAVRTRDRCIPSDDFDCILEPVS